MILTKHNIKHKSKITCRCLSPQDIDRVRSTLKKQYYSVPNNITFQEVEIILKPLFQQISLDINVINDKVHIGINNKMPPKNDYETGYAILDLINEWNVQERFRKFLIKSMSNANKQKIYRYQEGMSWRCPLNVYYVFKKNSDDFII